MTLVVETGTGSATAESLCSVAAATAYHSARGNAAWAALTAPRKEQCLRLATEYLAGAYGGAWQGSRAVDGQALDWPRTGVVAFEQDVAENAVPLAVVNACAVLALKAATAPLAADLGREIKSSKIGPIETTYADRAPQSKRYLAVDRMLEPYLESRNPYSARLERG